MRCRFIVDGPLKGYRASVARVFKKDPMAKLPQLAAFKEKVQWLAVAAGYRFRDVTPDKPVRLSVFVRWQEYPRIDWKNVYGLIEDAIFKQDRFVMPGEENGFCWDSGDPEQAEVLIEDDHQ